MRRPLRGRSAILGFSLAVFLAGGTWNRLVGATNRRLRRYDFQADLNKILDEQEAHAK
jgi:hypothetical protein